MSQRSAAQHCHIDTPFCTIRKSHVTWNFAVPGPHSEEIRRCILLFLCTLDGRLLPWPSASGHRAWSLEHERACSLTCVAMARVCIVQLGTVKLSRWRHWIPVWSSLIAEKRGADTEWLRRWPRERAVSFPVTPTCTRALRRWSTVYHRLLSSNDPAFWLIGSSWSLMRSLNSGARKEPWRVGSSQPSWKRQHAFVFSFSFFFHLPSVLVRSSKIEVFGMAVVGRGYNELERRRVFNKDVAWCWCWEFARVEWGFRAVQSSQWNKEKTEMRKW